LHHDLRRQPPVEGLKMNAWYGRKDRLSDIEWRKAGKKIFHSRVFDYQRDDVICALAENIKAAGQSKPVQWDANGPLYQLVVIYMTRPGKMIL
jgi:hypothetical protein